MFSMILVDDEKIVLQGIQKVFHMEEYGFEIKGVFQNPKQALEELPELAPQLIITDVKMPQMDGLHFAAKAKELLPEVEVVILSGYDDFSYAQTAMKVGVSDYLLKPIKKVDFVDMLKRMYEKIEEKAGQTAYYESLQEYAKNSQTELKNRFFLELAEHGCNDSSYIHTFLEKFQLDIQERDFLLVKFVMQDIPREKDFMSTIGKLMQEFRQELEEFSSVEVFFSDEEVYFLVYGAICLDCWSDLGESAFSFAEAKQQEGIRFSVGVSKTARGLEHLLVARNECDNQILLHQSQESKNAATGFSWMETDITIPYHDIESLFTAISMNSAEQMRQSIERIYQLPAHALYRDFSYSLTFIILLRLAHLLNRYDQEQTMIPRELLDIKYLKNHYSGIVAQKELIANTSVVLSDHMARQEVTSSAKIVRDALHYIQLHYNENISLSEVAEHISISKNYLCDIFKKELNVTFMNYVTNLRIEKAKELLTNTDMKMYEISTTVGYNDYPYFSQIFKKNTGTTLSAYRRQH